MWNLSLSLEDSNEGVVNLSVEKIKTNMFFKILCNKRKVKNTGKRKYMRAHASIHFDS